jgi:hypothetical protein
LVLTKKILKNFNILAALVIFRRDSVSLFVVEDAALLAVVVVADEVLLPFVCLFSFEFAAKE